MTQQHEYLPPTTDGRKFCRHCGTKWHADMTATCVERPGPPMPRPLPRSGVDDADAISARLIELQKERDAVLSAPMEE